MRLIERLWLVFYILYNKSEKGDSLIHRFNPSVLAADKSKSDSLDNILQTNSPTQKAEFGAEPIFSCIVFSIDSGSQGFPLYESARCPAGTLGQFEILAHLCQPLYYVKWTSGLSPVLVDTDIEI